MGGCATATFHGCQLADAHLRGCLSNTLFLATHSSSLSIIIRYFFQCSPRPSTFNLLSLLGDFSPLARLATAPLARPARNSPLARFARKELTCSLRSPLACAKER